MPPKHVRRSKEEHLHVVSEARKRFKEKEKKRKELLRSTGEDAMRVEQNLLMMGTICDTAAGTNVQSDEIGVAAVIITPQEMVTVWVTPTPPVEESVPEANTLDHVVVGFMEDDIVSRTTSTVVCWEGFIRAGVSYAKFCGGGDGDIFKACAQASQ